jgi:CheY-like chemotaxis protein
VIADRLHVILGSKFEHNEYSGFEVQPSGRVLWTPTLRQMLAGSVTRAVRTPSRIEHDLEATSLVSLTPLTVSRFTPDKAFLSERLLAYEMQYRVQPASSLSLALSAFVNRHDDLLSIEPGAPFTDRVASPPRLVVPIALANGLHGESYGFELTSAVELADWWRLLANEIALARDGEEALDFIFCRGAYASRTFGNPPRLVLLDLKLSKIEGLDVLRAIKGDPRTKAIPVVIMTSSREERDLVDSYKLGVNAYVQKPIDFDQFRTLVKDLGLFWLVINEPPPPQAFEPT